jgi:hypothetical protein
MEGSPRLDVKQYNQQRRANIDPSRGRLVNSRHSSILHSSSEADKDAARLIGGREV